VSVNTREHIHSGRSQRLARYAWIVLAWNLIVIMWGAFVRATGSGAGCGRHWPLCNGEVVPTPKSTATLIEASHRVSSGIALVLVVALMVWCLRALPKGDRARRASVFSAVFIGFEALIGAGLVLFELVAHDASMKRGLSMILHLGNTFFLLAALSLTAWWLTFPVTTTRVLEKGDKLLRAFLVAALGGILVLAASGAIAALGDTLFPARSLREGMVQELSPMAHAFVRLRMLHPALALMTGVFALCMAGVVRVIRPEPRVRKLSRLVTIFFVTQFAIGMLNVALLAPVAVQLVHLLMADLTWIALVLMSWEAVYALPQSVPSIMSRKGPAPISDVPPSTSNVEPVT
jgi:heme A synthase